VKTSKIGEVAEQVRGVTYAKKDASSEEQEGFSPILRANNISEDGLGFDDLVYVPDNKISDKQRIQINDVLIAASSGSIQVVGKAAQARNGFGGSFGAFCKVLRPSSEVNAHYFAHYFQTPIYRRTVSALAEGANINNLRNEHLNNLQIPLPPLEEQKRIAGILDAADILRAKRREALAKLDDLLQSTFLDLFGDPVTNPKGWEVKTLKEVAPAKSSKASFQPNELVWHLNLDQIESQSGQVFNKIYDLASEAGSSTHVFDTGNVLYSKLRPYLNKVVCPDSSGIATTELVPLRPIPGQIDRSYLTYFLRSQQFVRWVSNAVAGAKMPRVSMKVFWNHKLPTPPPDLQHHFAEIVSSVEEQKAKMRKHLEQLDDLFASLQQRAFRGDL